MFRIKRNIVAALGMVILLAGTAAFAQEKNKDSLTVRIVVADDSAESIKQRSGSGDPVAGKDKSLLCQGCHGEDGISVEPLIPKLAGQYAVYISKQLRNYQSGARTHQIMSAMAATINDEDLADISAFFASLNKMKGNGADNNPTGKNLFLNGDKTRMIVGCINCHGANGKGVSPTTPMFPVIGGQQREYIRGQLINFRAGDRSNSPNGIMNKITKSLSDTEIDSLADYVSAQ
jgi:cytochrome c553